MTISFRIPEIDMSLFKGFSKMKSITVSEFFREAAYKEIEAFLVSLTEADILSKEDKSSPF